jgi:hypothetical protein
MLALRFLLAACVMSTVAASIDSGEKTPTNNEKIVGVWEWTWEWHGLWRTERRTGPAVIEFTKDGKIKTSDKMEGTYDIQGDVLKAKLGETVITAKISFSVASLQSLNLTEEGEVGKTYRMRVFKKKATLPGS